MEDDIHDRYGPLFDDIFKKHKENDANTDVSMHNRNTAIAMKPPQQLHHSNQPHYDINVTVHDGNFGDFHGSQIPLEHTDHTMLHNKGT